MSSEDAPASSWSDRGRAWPALAAIIVVAWAVLLALVVGVGKILTGPLQDSVAPVDHDVTRWFVNGRSASLDPVAEWVALLGDTLIVVVLGPLVAIGMWVWQRDLRPVFFVVATSVGVSGIYILAASVIDRDRPPVKILDPGLDPTHSFPSGHVGAATALYGLIVVLVWTYTARKERWWVAPLLLVPLLVLVARLYQGAHHLSDVLASLAYASAWLAITSVLFLRTGRRDGQRRILEAGGR